MDYQALRNKMVEDQIMRRGVNDPLLIEAMRKVPRHEFVPAREVNNAYQDCPISIGCGQTISQPLMVALMTATLKLKKSEKVLEIGTGSGYQTALLAQLCQEVYTIEKIEPLSKGAQTVLQKLHYPNIRFSVSDGSQGWQDPQLKFDAIIVTAASPNRLEHLFEQMTPKGRMLIPLGDRFNQTLTLLTKVKEEIKSQEICRCVFVPLLGKFGWKEI